VEVIVVERIKDVVRRLQHAAIHSAEQGERLHCAASFFRISCSVMPLRPIDALLPRASRNFGGKAKSLATLIRAGFPVPIGYALSCEASAQHFAQALPPALQPARLLSRSGLVERDLHAARELVKQTPLAPDLVRELRRAFDALRAAEVHGVAVRSSSTGEDQSAASAAGLHTSVLNVTTERALFDAVRLCFAQVFSSRVVGYLQSLGHETVTEMGVVIQAMVPADVAGVMFTVNPLTGDSDEIVIDASYGLGGSVTDGRSTPDTYRIHKPTGWVRDRVLGDKRTRLVTAPGGGLREQPVPAALAQKQALDEHMLMQLVTLGRRVEEHFGDARDIEFAIAGDSIYLLQARAVTATPVRPAKARGRRKRDESDTSGMVWSNLNVGEALPGVATPLTWSVLSEFSELGFREAFAALGCKVPKDVRLVGNFRGRIYLNLSELTQVAAQVPGLRPSLVLSLGGGAELQRLELERKPPTPTQFLLKLPATAARFTRTNLGFHRKLAELEAVFEAERARIESLDFRILSASALDETLSDVHRMLRNVGSTLLNCYGGLLAVLVPLRATLLLLRGERAARVQHALISAIENVESAGPGREILSVAAAFGRDAAARELLLSSSPTSQHDLPQGEARAAVEAFLRLYGHRGVREAELAEPRWRENPRLLFDAVRVHLRHAPAEAEATLSRRIEAVRAASEEALASLPLPTRPPLRALLAAVRSYLRQRERLRSHVVHVLGLFRLVALDASRRLAVREPEIGPDAAFFLALEELHTVLRGEVRSVGALVRMRRAQYQRDRSLPDPPDTFVGYPPSSAFDHAAVRAAAYPDLDAAGTRCLTGLGASSGAAEGSVRVLRSVDDASSMVAGEILVVPSADVGWAPLFVAAAALVTDLGGPLSHACVVAREYGLPAVVNVRSATHALKTGDRVRVDGDEGTVLRLSS
jgi:pyruvate,water dikinase